MRAVQAISSRFANATMLLTVFYAPQRTFTVLARTASLVPFLLVLGLIVAFGWPIYLEMLHNADYLPDTSVQGKLGRLAVVFAMMGSVLLFIPLVNTLLVGRLRRHHGTLTRTALLAAFVLGSLPMWEIGGRWQIMQIVLLLPYATPSPAGCARGVAPRHGPGDRADGPLPG